MSRGLRGDGQADGLRASVDGRKALEAGHASCEVRRKASAHEGTLPPDGVFGVANSGLERCGATM
jgi:hypothetical protein